MKTITPTGKLPYTIPAKISWHITPYQNYMMKLKAQKDPTFKRCFHPAYNITQLFHQQLTEKAYGKIHAHFVIFIRGLTGVDVATGTFKSSTAIELMALYDQQPTVQKIGFSNDELLEKVQQQINTNTPSKHTIYIRDETPESLRRRSNIEFNTLKEAIRQKQISFILVKPEIESLSAATFVLEPMYHSKDLQYVKHAVYVEGAGYVGSIILKIHLNNPLWKAYQPYKNAYLDKVINRQSNQFRHQELAERFIKTPQYTKCLRDGKLVRIRIKKYLREVYPNITLEESRFVMDTIQEIHETETGET